MTVDVVTQIMRDALFTIIKTASPLLLISLIVGLTISIFQTVTSIQEQTLTFVPKMLAIFLTLMLLGHWMINNMITFTQDLWNNFALFVR